MWPFKVKRQPEDTEERLLALEKAFRRLEEEWSEVYHKFRTLQMRVAKQAQRVDQASAQAEEAQPAERENGIPHAGPSSLSPRQMELQAKILARRQRLPEKGGEQ